MGSFALTAVRRLIFGFGRQAYYWPLSSHRAGPLLAAAGRRAIKCPPNHGHFATSLLLASVAWALSPSPRPTIGQCGLTDQRVSRHGQSTSSLLLASEVWAFLPSPRPTIGHADRRTIMCPVLVCPPQGPYWPPLLGLFRPLHGLRWPIRTGGPSCPPLASVARALLPSPLRPRSATPA